MPLPSAMTPDMPRQAYELAILGIPRCHIADKLGVGRRTFYDWIAKGDAILDGEMDPPRDAGNHPPDYAAFARALRMAEADAVIASASAIRTEKGSPGHQWWLERTHPNEFGNRQKLEVEHSGTVQIIDWSTNAAGALAERMAEVPAIDAEFSSVDALAVPRGTPALTTTKPAG